jgi:hypothetical protein
MFLQPRDLPHQPRYANLFCERGGVPKPLHLRLKPLRRAHVRQDLVRLGEGGLHLGRRRGVAGRLSMGGLGGSVALALGD